MIRHGGDVYSHPVQYDFSANVNPLGLPLGVRKALVEGIAAYAQYPDPNCTALRRAIAEREQLSPAQIVCGNGASELIDRIVRTFRPKAALLPAPTFTEYERALQLADCAVRYAPLSPSHHFMPDEAFCAMLHDVDMVFLCNPNNPTGTLLAPSLLKKICTQCVEAGVILVLDECFLTLTGEEKACHMVPWEEHLLVLRAFTKTYAMAGLRLGYVLCANEKTAEEIASCGPCWSVSVPAQLAGVAALKEQEYLRVSLQMISEERDFLQEGLQRLGLQVFPSSANFLLFFCNRPLDALLLPLGIAIRSCDDFVGLSRGYYRISVRTHSENLALLRAIGEVL